ncbi:nitrate ABC transporter permease [uncultured Ferrovibrio sp.]|jgi:nitrate ABC transporter, permease protein|uniref:nitrate ABC transporter permease n=1 Tax=uncultured Ferrovibrio sp. TaxID=1576913 RepID=UPI00260422CC|nr:nitrate ABC transporter permease [uncultured Ferrovibrio sp.]
MAIKADVLKMDLGSEGFLAALMPRVLGGLRYVATRVLPPVMFLALIIGVWEIACSGPDATLPPPSVVIEDTWVLISDPFFDKGNLDKGLFWHLASSLKRVAIGFALAASIGIALGVLIGQSTLAFRGLDPIFQVLRTVPPLAWLPLSLAAFRNADPSAIFVIAITAIWPIILNTAVGIRNIPQDYRNVAQVLRLNGFEYFFKVMLPATVPFMFTGLKIGIGLSWLAIVAAEMLIGGVGIGFFIWDAWNSSLISEIILALIYVGLVGFMLDRLIAFIGNRIGGYAQQ